jgi:hypothetical protein
VFHSEAASCTPLLIRVDPGPSSSLNLDFSHFLSILQSPQCFLQPCCNSKAPHCAGQSNASVWHRLVHSDGTVFQKIRGICLFGSSSPRSTQMTPLSDGEHPQANAAPPPASSDLQGASIAHLQLDSSTISSGEVQPLLFGCCVLMLLVLLFPAQLHSFSCFCHQFLPSHSLKFLPVPRNIQDASVWA